MITKFDNYSEQIDFQKTKEWLTDQILNTKGLVKQSRIKEKYIDYLDTLDSFSEENQNITKKELTVIKNSFDKLFSQYYGGLKHANDKEERENFYNKLGVKSWEYEGPLRLVSVYGIIDAQRNIDKFNEFKLKPIEKEYIEKWYPNLEYWASLWKKTEEIRSILNPTKEEKERKEIQVIKGKLNPKIRKAIDEIAEDFRKVIEETELNYFTKTVERYIKKYGKAMTYEDRQKDKETPRIIFDVYKKVSKRYEYIVDHQLIPNWKELIANKAKDISEETILKFKIKMYDKIGGLVSDIDVDFDVKVYGRGMYHNDIYFNFVDGSKFSIKNQIVSKFSNQGTFFYTYPTTFHNAYLPNGKKIENPNEYTVKKAFNDYHKK